MCSVLKEYECKVLYGLQGFFLFGIEAAQNIALRYSLFLYRKFIKSAEIVYNGLEIKRA